MTSVRRPEPILPYRVRSISAITKGSIELLRAEGRETEAAAIAAKGD